MEQSLAAVDTAVLRGAVIKNTLELEHLWVTESVAAELAARKGIEVLSKPAPLVFSGGRMVLEF